ncbi:hypothetical protein STVIR_2799 [Streptomyces viridochromogenes Tue57]|uniref:Uncharacterized protein n=1 Tax=Streptomyces viridochromogenes Tue57 TaxID=1160705 RepID=L8PLP7_STRVR|nr:hypothetical protein STVIR_2799 [Streptomyces viridochromogenes Tue57]
MRDEDPGSAGCHGCGSFACWSCRVVVAVPLTVPVIRIARSGGLQASPYGSGTPW